MKTSDLIKVVKANVQYTVKIHPEVGRDIQSVPVHIEPDADACRTWVAGRTPLNVSKADWSDLCSVAVHQLNVRLVRADKPLATWELRPMRLVRTIFNQDRAVFRNAARSDRALDITGTTGEIWKERVVKLARSYGCHLGYPSNNVAKVFDYIARKLTPETFNAFKADWEAGKSTATTGPMEPPAKPVELPAKPVELPAAPTAQAEAAG